MAIYVDKKLTEQGQQFLYISGQTPGLETGTPIEAGEQLDVIIQKIDKLLKSEGLTAKHLIKVTILITDRKDLGVVREKLGTFFGETKPAATLAIVSGFIDEAFKVEIDAVAAF